MKYHYSLYLFVAFATPEAQLLKIVFQRGMERYFQGVFGALATKGEIPKRIGEKNGWDPGDTLMVVDAVSDFAGAQSSGVAFVAICDGECPAWLDNAAEQLSDLTEFERIVHGPN